jgi:hypothetical protein
MGSIVDMRQKAIASFKTAANVDFLRWLVSSSSARIYRTHRLVGVSLLMFGTTILGTQLLPTRQVRASEERTLAGETAPTQRKMAIDPLNEEDQKKLATLGRFDALLLAPADLPDTVFSLFNVFKLYALDVGRADYQWSSDPVGRFDRVQIRVELSGEGSTVEQAMQTAMSRHPGVALTAFRIAREGAKKPIVSAQAQFNIYLVHAASTSSDSRSKPLAQRVAGVRP